MEEMSLWAWSWRDRVSNSVVVGLGSSGMGTLATGFSLYDPGLTLGNSLKSSNSSRDLTMTGDVLSGACEARSVLLVQDAKLASDLFGEEVSAMGTDLGCSSF